MNKDTECFSLASDQSNVRRQRPYFLNFPHPGKGRLFLSCPLRIRLGQHPRARVYQCWAVLVLHSFPTRCAIIYLLYIYLQCVRSFIYYLFIYKECDHLSCYLWAVLRHKSLHKSCIYVFTRHVIETHDFGMRMYRLCSSLPRYFLNFPIPKFLCEDECDGCKWFRWIRLIHDHHYEMIQLPLSMTNLLCDDACDGRRMTWMNLSDPCSSSLRCILRLSGRQSKSWDANNVSIMPNPVFYISGLHSCEGWKGWPRVQGWEAYTRSVCAESDVVQTPCVGHRGGLTLAVDKELAPDSS